MRSSTIITALVSLCSLQSAQAWTAPKGPNSQPPAAAEVSRKSMLQTLVQGGVATAAATFLVEQPAWAGEKLPSGVAYEVVKNGSGIKPEIGELIAIRFAAFVEGRKIDDIFDTPEPYYTRLGSGGLLKGVESTLPLMKLGDRWKLTIPVSKIEKSKSLISRGWARVNTLSCLIILWSNATKEIDEPSCAIFNW